MPISKRLTNLPASPIRKLTPYATDAKNRGIHVYHLNIGQPDIRTPEAVLDRVRNLDMDVLAYGPSEGLDEYRSTLPAYYRGRGIPVDKEDILVTTAGSEAVFFAMFAVCDPGDEIIIPEPYYTNYNGFAGMAGVNIVPITCSIENGFALPGIDDFKNKITPRTRAIMICSPNNPTGAVYSREALAALADLCMENDLYLIADEVYREFVYDGPAHTSILEFPDLADRAIVVDSISKRYSACGARIGALVCKNRELTAGILKVAQARLCPPTIEQIAAAAAIETPQEYFDSVKKEYMKRRDIVFNALSDILGVVCRKPAGAFYIVASLPVENAEDFAVFMLKDFSSDARTVMVAPAEGFYGTPGLGRNQIRIAYVLKEEDLKEAMDILKKGLSAYRLVETKAQVSV